MAEPKPVAMFADQIRAGMRVQDSWHPGPIARITQVRSTTTPRLVMFDGDSGPSTLFTLLGEFEDGEPFHRLVGPDVPFLVHPDPVVVEATP